MTRTRAFALLATLILSTFSSLQADPLMQKVTFAAMSHEDPDVVGAVNVLMRKGFLAEIVGVVEKHVRETGNQGATLDPAEAANKITSFGRNWISQSFNTKDRRVKSININSIDWKPGNPIAVISYTFDLTDFSGIINKFRTFKGYVKVDVRTWLAADWKHRRI